MTSIQVQLPDALADTARRCVAEGYCKSESEVFALALSEFIRHHRPDLTEQQAMEDISWAKELVRQSH